MASDNTVSRQKDRAERVWEKRSPWDAAYRDCYDFCIPHRRAGGADKSKRLGDRIFDMTATMSAMYFAGNLQRDLFPTGRPPFTLKTGEVAKLRIGQRGTDVLDRELANVSQRMYPFFLNGEWDTAIHETCIDLGVGTGAIMPVKGTRDNPVMFVAIPFDQLALANDAWGRLNFVSWRQVFERQAIVEAFPQGRFSDEFLKQAKLQPYNEIRLYQDFVKLPDGRWRYLVYVERDCDAFIAEDTYRTQPLAVPRYYRVPGEAYGRGPILLAMPSIKTLNKAQELALKAAAIQMLGIWGYRAGGTFNPDTVRVSPGEFWPMQSTGGILGPDVSRIDPPGRLDVGQLVIGNLQDQIRQSLFDMRLQDNGAQTPKSASEIVARLRQKAEVHIGAFGRLVREIMPVIVPRVAEILYEFGFMGAPLRVDDFLVAVSVESPMAAALNADRLAGIANYIEFVGAIAGPQAVEQYAHIDKVLGLVGEGLQVPKELIPTEEERAQIQQRQAAQQAALLMAEMAMKGGGEMRMAA